MTSSAKRTSKGLRTKTFKEMKRDTAKRMNKGKNSNKKYGKKKK